MPHSVAFDRKERIVCVSVFGDATKEDHLQACAEALRLCEKHACTGLLVDLHELTRSSLSTADSFAFGERIAEFPRFIRLAHVLPTHPAARKNVLLASTVEANRGKEAREFDTVREAKAWLVAQ